MDLQDLNVAVAEIRGNVDRNTGRIKDLEKKTDAVAKLAEAVHAELYLQAYNNIDAADDDSYFLCPGCGYIEKGSAAPEKCPICGAPAKVFKQF